MLHRILPFLFLLALPAPGQEDPLVPRELVYVARLGETEIGRETVTLRPDGWESRGRFDVLGTRKGSFEASLSRKGGAFTYGLKLALPERTVEMVATFADATFTVRVPGTEKSKAAEVAGGAEPVPYDDLVWACFLRIGEVLATTEPGSEFVAAVGSAAVTFSVEHVASETVPQVVKGRTVPLRVSRIRFPGPLEMVVVATPAGLPLRIEVPAQKIAVQAVGYEDVRGQEREPTSIVDSGPWRAKLSKPEHEVVVERGVMMPMRDGIRLAADVYRPAGEGKRPTILARTPYGRGTQGGLDGTYYARRGYVYVAQDVRGRFDSEGHWFPFVHETADGSDTLDWIARQPWSDGGVGMLGASYVGLVQWLAAKSGNPHLKCIAPQVSPPDPHENFPYEGGAFLLGAAWWARVLESMKHGGDWRQGLDWEAAFTTLPLGDLDEAVGLKEPSFLDTWLGHPPHDRGFWSHASYQHLFRRMTVPALHVSGWYDGDMPGALQNWVGMRAGAATEAARRGQYLVMGPWTHFFNSARRMGEVDFGDEAVVDLDARTLRFFDRYLKGVENGIEDEPPVLVFTMGTNRWHAEAAWPLPGTRFTALHLASGGDAARRDGGGRLQLEPGGEGRPSERYRYDPHELPELDVDFEDVSGAEAVADRSKDEDRTDDLEYTSAPLATDCEILGPVSVVLWVESDAADTDFCASLYRLTPGGGRFVIRGGLQRLRYARSPVEDHPVPPGAVTRLEIDCWATGLRLRRGERLQLVISSRAWPGYGRNLNTLESPLTARRGVVATNVVHHTKERPSHLLLPVVPREDAPGLRFEER